LRHFYHGTNVVIGNIDLSHSRSRTDFGKGFYMGNNLGMARRWAVSQSTIAETPTVMRYTLSDTVFNFNDSGLKRLWFTAPTVEWLDFVRDISHFRIDTVCGTPLSVQFLCVVPV